MKTTIKRIKSFINLDKQLDWINQMNRKGWKLVDISALAFRFTKCEPEEYTTNFYPSEKNRLMKDSTIAAQSGYETVPHRWDGLGNLLILTGRTDAVADEFMSDNEGKMKWLTFLQRYYCKEGLIAFIAGIILLGIAYIPIPPAIYILRNKPQMIYLAFQSVTNYIGTAGWAMMLFFGILFVVCGAYELFLFLRTRKRLKKLQKEMTIFQ